MHDTRYNELSRNLDLKLTPEEIAEGWFFCECEWDGMLIHRTSQEARVCTCFQEEQERANNPRD